MSGTCLRRISCLSLLLFLNVSAGYGAEDTAGKGKHFLWEIQGKGGSAFLFGGVHLAKPGISPLPRKVQEAFATAELLALEADPGSDMTEDLQQKLVRSALYTNSDSLRQHLSDNAYEKTAHEMQRLGLAIDQFARSKPWFVAMTINILGLQQLGYSPDEGIDRHFAERARGDKKIVELESLPYKINLLNSLSEADQELFLLYTIQENASMREGADAIMRAWETGDTEGMEKIMTGALDAFPEAGPVYGRLHTQRNREMAGRIEQLIQSGERCLVVVGAAHLVGTEGIIELLKRRGYRTEQQ